MRLLKKGVKKQVFGVVALTCLFWATQAQGASFVLTGNFLKVGVSESGGLIDDFFNAGINFDPTGTGSFPASPPAADYLRPGTPFEFYSIGIAGSWSPAGYHDGNSFGMVTTNNSVGTSLLANSVGAFGDLSIEQDLAFDMNSTIIDFRVTLTNVGASTLTDVAYARGLDPDQDRYPSGTFVTNNSIPDLNRVRATGPVSGWFIDITDLSGGGVPTVDSIWDKDPYDLLIPHNDGDGDYAINMAYDLGDLGPGDFATLHFTYTIGESFAPIPEPATMALLGMGLAGAGLRRWRQKTGDRG